MKIAIIGAGNVGKTLGAALRAKGHTVIYGPRDPGDRPSGTSGRSHSIGGARR